MKRFLLTTGVFLSLNLSAQTFDWVKQMGGSDNDESKSITTDASGNIYMTGKFASTTDFDPNAGTSNLTSAGMFDAFVAKYSAQGNLIWVKSFSGVNAVIGLDLAVDATGNVYAVGYFEGTVDLDPGAGTMNFTSNGTDDAYIVKLDPSGNLIWAKTIGGPNYDSAAKIVLDYNGNLVIGGGFVSSMDMDPGPGTSTLTSNGSSDIFILKLNSSGDYLTSFHLGSSSWESVAGIVIDASNNMYITGDFSYTVNFDPNGSGSNLVATGSSDAYICKYDSDYQLVWARKIGGIDQEYTSDIALSSTGDVLVSGLFFATCDVDPGSGVVEYSPAPGFGNTFVVSLDNNGNYNWSSNLGGTHFTEGMSLALDSEDNTFVSGIFRGTLQLDVDYTATGNRDVFMVKLSPTGSLLTSMAFGGYTDEYVAGICIDGNDNVFTTGHFAQDVDFDPGSGTTELVANGLWDIYLHKMASGTVGIEQVSSTALTVYPNPSNSIITIESTFALETIQIFSLQGEMVMESTAATIDISSLSAGMYILQVNSGGTLFTKQIIKN